MNKPLAFLLSLTFLFLFSGIKTNQTSKLKSYNIHEKLLQQYCYNICKFL